MTLKQFAEAVRDRASDYDDNETVAEVVEVMCEQFAGVADWRRTGDETFRTEVRAGMHSALLAAIDKIEEVA